MTLDLNALAEEIYSHLYIAYEANDDDEKDGLELLGKALLRVREKTIKECLLILREEYPSDHDVMYGYKKILSLLESNKEKM